MSGNEFTLPDDLGWECNDEVSKIIADWLTRIGKDREKKNYATGNEFKLYIGVAIAELSDDVYSVIKKYQQAQNG